MEPSPSPSAVGGTENIRCARCLDLGICLYVSRPGVQQLQRSTGEKEYIEAQKWNSLQMVLLFRSSTFSMEQSIKSSTRKTAKQTTVLSMQESYM